MYKLEVWGAQGGSFDTTFHGGYDGYSTGMIDLESKSMLYVVVGKSTSSESCGYNGGGSGRVWFKGYAFTSYGGGGAIGTFSNDYSTNLLIVAGGGGGAIGTSHQDEKRYNSIGGSGGGEKGADGNSNAGSSRIGTGVKVVQTNTGM